MRAVTYGWLARLPTLQHGWSLFLRFIRVCTTASRDIRACLLGGNSHLQVLAVKQLLKAVLCRDSRTIDRWSAGVAHHVFALRGAFMRMSWQSRSSALSTLSVTGLTRPQRPCDPSFSASSLMRPGAGCTAVLRSARFYGCGIQLSDLYRASLVPLALQEPWLLESCCFFCVVAGLSLSVLDLLVREPRAAGGWVVKLAFLTSLSEYTWPRSWHCRPSGVSAGIEVPPASSRLMF